MKSAPEAREYTLEELLEHARTLDPTLVNHRHCADAVVAQRNDTKQFVHFPHANLRSRLDAASEARPPGLTTLPLKRDTE